MTAALPNAVEKTKRQGTSRSRVSRLLEGKGRPGPERRRLRQLYVNLLIRSVANTIYPDPSIAPWNKGTVDPKLRRIGRDWPSQAHTMVGLKRLRNLARLMQRCIDEGIAGDFIETGVWRGGCCILMRGILAANGVTDRRVYVADSFRGLPPPVLEQDADARFHTLPQLAVGRKQVEANFMKYGLLDDNVVFVEGWFRDTLPKLEAGPFALIRLDGDMYDSTMVALESLYPRVSERGCVVIDDYILPACREAVTDYRRSHDINDPIHDIDGDGVWWRKGSTERRKRSRSLPDLLSLTKSPS